VRRTSTEAPRSNAGQVDRVEGAQPLRRHRCRITKNRRCDLHDVDVGGQELLGRRDCGGVEQTEQPQEFHGQQCGGHQVRFRQIREPLPQIGGFPLDDERFAAAEVSR
jgi:hypothetical protein